MTLKITKKPNVIVFFTDQQRWDTLGIHGNPCELTPNLDRFSRYNTHFENAFTCQPVCGPARSSLQTGLYPTSTGCFRNGIPLPTHSKSLGSYFQEAGYKTAYIGKWHLGGGEPVALERRQGYDYWLAANSLEHTSDAYNTVVYDNQGDPVHLPGYRVDALTDASIRFVADNYEQPFFLFLSFLEPHHQNHRDDYPAPEGYRERYTSTWMPADLAALVGSTYQHLPGYMGMVKRLDEAFGRLLDCLISLGIRDETIVVFTSDHGNHFKTRNTEYKRSCHESSIRIPLVIGGGEFAEGGRRRQLISLIDLPPTLLDAAGIQTPKEMHGHSVMSMIRGEKTVWSDDVFVQISESQVGRCLRTSRWKYSVSSPDRNGSKDSYAPSYVEEFLYDLHSDPYELNNLVGLKSHRDVADALRMRLLKRILEIEGESPTILPADTRASGQRIVYDSEIPT